MDPALLARSFGGLAAILAALALALWAVRRFDLRLPGRVGVRTRGRIGVVERVTVDQKRSLLLVRRDDREHLLLISPEGHVLIAEQPAPVDTPYSATSRSESAAFAPLVDAGLVDSALEPWLCPAELPGMAANDSLGRGAAAGA